MPSSRTVIRWMSLLIAVIGWGLVVVRWVQVGHQAGVDAAFVVGIGLGICFTVVWARAVADHQDRDRERVYALGVRHGLALGAEVGQAKRDAEAEGRRARLRSV